MSTAPRIISAASFLASAVIGVSSAAAGTPQTPGPNSSAPTSTSASSDAPHYVDESAIISKYFNDKYHDQVKRTVIAGVHGEPTIVNMEFNGTVAQVTISPGNPRQPGSLGTTVHVETIDQHRAWMKGDFRIDGNQIIPTHAEIGVDTSPRITPYASVNGYITAPRPDQVYINEGINIQRNFVGAGYEIAQTDMARRQQDPHPTVTEVAVSCRKDFYKYPAYVTMRNSDGLTRFEIWGDHINVSSKNILIYAPTLRTSEQPLSGNNVVLPGATFRNTLTNETVITTIGGNQVYGPGIRQNIPGSFSDISDLQRQITIAHDIATNRVPEIKVANCFEPGAVKWLGDAVDFIGEKLKKPEVSATPVAPPQTASAPTEAPASAPAAPTATAAPAFEEATTFPVTVPQRTPASTSRSAAAAPN